MVMIATKITESFWKVCRKMACLFPRGDCSITIPCDLCSLHAPTSNLLSLVVEPNHWGANMSLEICMVLNILGELVVGSATLLLHFWEFGGVAGVFNHSFRAVLRSEHNLVFSIGSRGAETGIPCALCYSHVAYQVRMCVLTMWSYCYSVTGLMASVWL